MTEKFEVTYNRLDSIPALDRQTDRNDETSRSTYQERYEWFINVLLRQLFSVTPIKFTGYNNGCIAAAYISLGGFVDWADEQNNLGQRDDPIQQPQLGYICICFTARHTLNCYTARL